MKPRRLQKMRRPPNLVGIVIFGVLWALPPAAPAPPFTDVARATTSATCETSNTDDVWRPGDNSCERLLKGTDLWGANTGVHIPKGDGSSSGWAKILFASPSTILSVTVKQCDVNDPQYVSQNFKIESVDELGQYALLVEYGKGSLARKCPCATWHLPFAMHLK